MNTLSPFPLASRYARFRDAIFSHVAETSAKLPLDLPMSELDVQSLWFAGAFGREFISLDGQCIRILDFGEWNSSPGPDFKKCCVEINGQPVRGDIELDSDARDWEHHAHGSNTDYAEVVLHLFMSAPGQRFYTRTCEHLQVAQVRLHVSMLEEDAKPNRDLAAARLGRCATPLRHMEPTRVESILESAAQYRLERKSRRLHAAVNAHGREQAIYQSLAQALGYQNNQAPFLILSQRLPWKRLKAEPQEEREAWLFGLSGFLPDSAILTLPPESRGYLRELWSRWWRLRDASQRWLTVKQRPRWKLSTVRPGNHPQRRLGALAAMMESWDRVSAPLMDAGRWSQPAWKETLKELQHPFWSTHYTLLAPASKSPQALIGETRIHEMLANVAYPLLIPERTRLWAEYLELPAMLDNQKVRRACLRLFGGSKAAAAFQKKLHQHQGLLQLYEDFCLEDDSSCSQCPFPERLKEWT